MTGSEEDPPKPAAQLTIREEVERRRRIEEDFATEFGRTIQRERTRRGWTADEAAKRAQVAPKTWKRLEDGKRVQGLTLNKVDKLFGLPEGTAFDVWLRQGDLQAALNQEQGVYRGLASLVPTKPSLDELLAEEEQHADEIIQLLPELSLEDLDKVITAANATRNSRVTEISKMMKLPLPIHFRRGRLSMDQIQDMSPGMHMRWLDLNRQYAMAHQEAVRALARKLDSEQPGESDGAAEEAVRTATRYAGELAALINLTRRNEREEVHDGER